MCKYPGWEIVELCRAIAAHEDDLREVIRKDAGKAPSAVRAAREALERSGDVRAQVVLDRVASREEPPSRLFRTLVGLGPD